MYLFYLFQCVQSHVEQQLRLVFAAEHLHGSGDSCVQFLPVDALATLYRSVNPGFFQGYLFTGHFTFVYLLAIIGSFTPCVSARRCRVAVVAGGERLLPGNIQPVQSRLQVPVNNGATTAGGPSVGWTHSFDVVIVHQQVLGRIETSFIIRIDDVFSGRFLTQHQFPSYLAFYIRHCREITVEW